MSTKWFTSMKKRTNRRRASARKVPASVDVTAIRAKLGLTQEKFAKQVEAGREFMKDNRDAFKALAK